MAQTLMSIRIDEDLKNDFERYCGMLGMSMSTAFIIFAKTFVRERKMPFEIRLQEPSREEAKAALSQIRDYAKKNGTSEMTMEEIDEEIKLYRKEKRTLWFLLF